MAMDHARCVVYARELLRVLRLKKMSSGRLPESRRLFLRLFFQAAEEGGLDCSEVGLETKERDALYQEYKSDSAQS